MKIGLCQHCGEEFIPKNTKQVYCSRRCVQKQWYKNNPDKVKLKREIQNKDDVKRILSRIKSRAKRENIPFDLEYQDISVPEFCPVLGIKLERNYGRSGYYGNSMSLDKIIPHKGYVKDNVRIISARANLLKNDATIEELEKVLNDLKELKRAGRFI